MDLKSKKNIFLGTGATFSIIGSMWAGLLALDSKYASAQDVQQVKQEVQIIKLNAIHEKALDDYYRTKSISLKYPEDQQLSDDLEKSAQRLKVIERKIESFERGLGREN